MSVAAEFKIRRLSATDAEAFSVLRREVTGENPVPMGLTMDEELARPIEGFRAQLSAPAPNVAFGAFVGMELIGSSALAWPSNFASSRHKSTLWGTFISPRYRRRGIGRALVEEIVRYAQAENVRRINLTVYVPNTPAVSLYESLGFEHCGIEPEAVLLGRTYFDGQQMSLRLRVA
jgi:ribosomal protein S18 acetylase RimI-like enzyme